jgi:hypothetical protein
MGHGMNYAVRSRGKAGRRAHPRHYVELLAMLMTERHELIGAAKVEDMSGGGARLILSDKLETLPDQFVMALSSISGPKRSCSVVWRARNVVGVRFL